MFKSTIMLKYSKLIIFFSFFIFFYIKSSAQLRTGAEQIPAYLPLLKGKNIALVVNQTSVIGQKHLVDSLRSLKITIKAIFAPEHGFRGDHSAGEKVNSSVDEKTKLPLISLYGSHKKPTV